MSVNLFRVRRSLAGSVNVFSIPPSFSGSVSELKGSGLYLPGQTSMRHRSSGKGLFLPGQTGRGVPTATKKTVAGLQSLAAIQKAEMSTQRAVDTLAPNANENPLTSVLRASKAQKGRGLYTR